LLKPFARAAVRSPAANRLFAMLERFESRSFYHFRALTYHRIADAVAFTEQVAFLVEHYRVVGMDDLLAAVAGRRTLPPRALLITFDDAYQEFADVAWPILQHHGLPVTLFVPSGFAHKQAPVFWWDVVENAFLHTERGGSVESPAGRLFLETEAQRRQAVKRVKQYLWTVAPEQVTQETERLTADLAVAPPAVLVLDWGELRRLAAEGVTLGAHTRTHPNLAKLDPEAARAEIAGSWHDLISHVGEVAPVFAYPGGQYGRETVELVAEAGFKLAFTTRRGVNDVRRREKLLELRRINVSPGATVGDLRARLLQASLLLGPHTIGRLSH
jgi:peptidoglycan/xylan/chitin deacetylase (PgdA/CDA1 family)